MNEAQILYCFPGMPRKNVPNCPDSPYSIGARCINKEWFQLPMHLVWNIFCDDLYFVSHAFNVKILSFVLMHNHFHLMAQFPEMNRSAAMNYFMREVSRKIGYESGRINQVFGGRHFRSQIGNFQYYRNAYKYIYRNPVEAGLCDRPENYAYSTLNGLLGRSKILIPVCDETLFSDLEGTLSWLNKKPTEKNREAMRKALKRKEFSIPRQKGKLHMLESNDY